MPGVKTVAPMRRLRDNFKKQSIQYPAALRADFCNKIGTKPTFRHVRFRVAIGTKADIAQGALSMLAL